MKNPLRIALIGSRSLHTEAGHEADIKLLHKLCYRLAQLKIRFTSGLCAQGLDAIAQIEYSRAVEKGDAYLSQFEVYVYDIKAIHQSRLPNKHLAVVRNQSLRVQAEKLAASVHPCWERCSDYAKGQHARNAHQIFGHDLNQPVDAVITWCKTDKNNNPLGGTATAIKLAAARGIPVFNLKTEDQKAVLNQIHAFLKLKKVHGVK